MDSYRARRKRILPIGTAPLGNLAAGFLAHRFGAHVTVFIAGIVCLLASALFAKNLSLLRDMVRPIYIKKGIIREVAFGVQNAEVLAIPPED